MGIMNTAPKGTTIGATGMKPPPSRPVNAPAAATAPPSRVMAKKKPMRGNIGRMLREKLG